MINFTVEHLLNGRSYQAGSASKLITNAGNTARQAASTPASTDSQVSLSPAAKQISLLLKNASTMGKDAAASFDAFLDGNHQQIEAQGSDAAFLGELPDDLQPDRQTLAKQAANYLLAFHYGEPQRYQDASAENPFAALDRVVLSNIAFNDSGLFTAAERQVAFLEMTNRDIQHRNATYDLAEELRRKDGATPEAMAVPFLRDAQLFDNMSEGEKVWRKWPPASEMRAIAASMLRNDSSREPTLPEYQNLNNQDKPLLAYMVGKDGSGSWQNVALEELASDLMPLRLIHSLIEKNQTRQPEHPWLSIYLSIDSLGR
ncbi:hypothetical protein ACJRW5_20660 [Pseudomonas sp. SH1-B]